MDLQEHQESTEHLVTTVTMDLQELQEHQESTEHLVTTVTMDLQEHLDLLEQADNPELTDQIREDGFMQEIPHLLIQGLRVSLPIIHR
jgi:hypothetical protein